MYPRVSGKNTRNIATGLKVRAAPLKKLFRILRGKATACWLSDDWAR
jgi:hypothetical protein|tara:strand:- start:668 stop:808 length:141 start_codon:yes stop_codon:yes gene_type:complete